jgi:hypothetical protein
MNPATAAEDFPVTRSAIDELDGWLHRLATPVLPARKVQRGGRHRWELRDRNAYALMIAKAVRMASGIRAAMLLIDNGFLPESACLLRVVSDLSLEIVAVAEGELRGQPTKAQQDFVTEFFARRSLGDDTGPKQEKKRYVSREELMKTHVRLAMAANVDGEELRDMMRTVAGVSTALCTAPTQVPWSSITVVGASSCFTDMRGASRGLSIGRRLQGSCMK